MSMRDLFWGPLGYQNPSIFKSGSWFFGSPDFISSFGCGYGTHGYAGLTVLIEKKNCIWVDLCSSSQCCARVNCTLPPCLNNYCSTCHEVKWNYGILRVGRKQKFCSSASHQSKSRMFTTGSHQITAEVLNKKTYYPINLSVLSSSSLTFSLLLVN